MKRRTNLFYENIKETNFLTFSNYTEHITGVFLATNYKLFPSRFICMNIPKLKTDEDRTEFIQKYLVGYYENKLSMLRDIIVNSKNTSVDKDSVPHPDEVMQYLGYLIDCIMMYDPDSTIQYISKITEQDYNGTFTDIICTIDSSEALNNTYNIDFTEYSSEYYTAEKECDKQYLYGWAIPVGEDAADYQGPVNYATVKPIFDIDSQYSIEPYHFKIRINDEGTKSNNSIEFNVIIPLYDVTLFDVKTNATIIREPDYEITDEYYEFEKDLNNQYYLDLNKKLNNGDFKQNIPYGIWFANETITLNRDKYTNYAPSWSLLIGTQFKPFPNSNLLTQDGNSGSDMGGFATFAQILTRQNKLYDQWESNFSLLETLKTKVEESISYISGMIDQLDIPSKTDIDNIKNRLSYLESELNSGNGGTSHKWQWKNSINA